VGTWPADELKAVVKDAFAEAQRIAHEARQRAGLMNVNCSAN
jgi:hypothetical protein